MPNRLMEISPTLIEKYQTAQPPLFRSERDELIQNFLNHDIRVMDRKTRELRVATAAELAIKLRYVPTEDLFAFHKMCLGARNYGRFFNWSLKPTKV